MFCRSLFHTQQIQICPGNVQQTATLLELVRSEVQASIVIVSSTHWTYNVTPEVLDCSGFEILRHQVGEDPADAPQPELLGDRVHLLLVRVRQQLHAVPSAYLKSRHASFTERSLFISSIRCVCTPLFFKPVAARTYLGRFVDSSDNSLDSQRDVLVMFVSAVHEANALVPSVSPEVQKLLHQERILKLYVVHMSVDLSKE